MFMDNKEKTFKDKAHIMIVEDDAALAGEIRHFLERWGYFAYIVRNFEEIIREYRQVKPCLVLMDINLPFYDGFYWCRRLREVSDVPVLFISSRGEDSDKLQAYAQGGDDYIEKPFRLELLQAKIEAVLRRTNARPALERIYLTEEVYFEPVSMSLFAGGQAIDLTRSERKVLAKLVESRGRTVMREELMMALWSTDEYVSDGSLTTLVSRLRSKLSESCGREIVMTRKGQGYYITCGE